MAEAYTQKWLALVPDRVYLSMASGSMTIEDMQIFDQKVISMLDASSSPLVHIISDVRHIASLPPLVEMRKNKAPQHPRMGYGLTIGAFRSPVMRFILTLWGAIAKLRYKDVETLSEACDYLAQKDPSLPPLSSWTLPMLTV